MNQSHTNQPKQRVTLPILEPLMRIWLYHLLKFQIYQTYSVQIEYNQKGLACTGTSEQNDTSIHLIKNKQKSIIVQGFQSDREWQKLQTLKPELQRVEMDDLRKWYEKETEGINLAYEYIVVYPKEREIEVLNLIGERFANIIEVGLDQGVVLLYCKIEKKLVEKHKCQVKISDSETKGKLKLTLKGAQSSLEEARKRINILSKQELIMVLSDKELKDHFQILSHFREYLKEKKYSTIYNASLEVICQKSPSKYLTEYNKMFVEKHGNFVGVIINKKDYSKVMDDKQRFLDQLMGRPQPSHLYYSKEQQPLQQIGYHSQSIVSTQLQQYEGYQPKPNINEQSRQYSGFQSTTQYHKPGYIQLKKTKFEQQNETEFPINKLIYHALHKFTNFHKKMTLLQNQHQIVIVPHKIERSQGEFYYCLKFFNPKRQQQIVNQLKFFFDQYKIRIMQCFIEKPMLVAKLQRAILKAVERDEEFKLALVDMFAFKNGVLSFQMYCGSMKTGSIDEELQKVIGKETGSLAKLRENKK